MIHSIGLRSRSAIVALALFAAASGGCLDGGLLITPVATNRALVEQVLRREAFLATDKIALIDVSGIILNAAEPRLIGAGRHQVSYVTEQFDKARKDAQVKAVLLRINSPGGGVVASALIYNEIKHFRKTTGKPVVAVMMDVAASGGYYIACACDEIIAQPSTVTGSIGVIMQLFEVSGTMELMGVTADAITSGPNKDVGSAFRKMKPSERKILQSIVNDMYDRFVDVVDTGRPNLSREEVRTLADGRVYSGHQALKAGLIDKIATIRETVQSLKKRIGAKKIKLVTYKRPIAFRPNYYAQGPTLPRSAGDINLINLDMAGWLNQSTPQFMYLWAPGRY